MPYPIIFGAITDSTCKVWEEKCGTTGNCWLYDVDKLRIYLHGAALAFVTLGTLFDIGIIALSDRIGNLYESDVADEPTDDINMNDVNAARRLSEQIAIQPIQKS